MCVWVLNLKCHRGWNLSVCVGCFRFSFLKGGNDWWDVELRKKWMFSLFFCGVLGRAISCNQLQLKCTINNWNHGCHRIFWVTYLIFLIFSIKGLSYTQLWSGQPNPQFLEEWMAIVNWWIHWQTEAFTAVAFQLFDERKKYTLHCNPHTLVYMWTTI